MTIAAKYSTKCPACNVMISAGAQVEWSKGSPARHVSCPGAAASSRPSAQVGYLRVGQATRYTSARRSSGGGSAASVPGYSSYCTGRDSCGCYDCAS